MAAYSHRDLKASLFYFCNQMKSELEGAGIASDVVAGSVEVFNFDAHADNVVLPDKHIIGISRFSTIEDDTIEIEALIGIGFKDDTNLFKMDHGVERIVTRLRPGKRIDLVDVSNGTKKGLLTSLSGLTVFPVDRTSLRPVQFVGVRLGTDSLTP